MAINFPTSLDNFTNPASGNTLDSPSHSLQHSDINDAVEALEAKVGIGASPAGSATSGQVLTAQGGGTAIWATPDSSGAWISWTPTISGNGWSVGNGTLQAFYKQIGKTVFFRIRFVLGSTTGKGTGTLGWSLPVNSVTGQTYAPFANSNYLDSGNQVIPGFAYSQGVNNIDCFVINTSGTYSTFANITSTIPFTWATNDEVLLNGTYEAA